MLCPEETEPARRARVTEPEKAVADVTRKIHRPDRKTRAAEAARVAERAAGRVLAKAAESGLNHKTVLAITINKGGDSNARI